MELDCCGFKVIRKRRAYKIFVMANYFEHFQNCYHQSPGQSDPCTFVAYSDTPPHLSVAATLDYKNIQSMLASKRFFVWGLLFILILIAFLSIIYPVRCIPWNVMICGPNEGWNAYFEEAAIKGERLYPTPDQLITNNYPPLSFYAVGLVGRLLGDPIVAGRWLAFFSLLTLAFFIFKIVKELGGGATAGILAAAFFVATMGLFFERYVAMNDPQLLAQAIIMSGFLLFLKAVRERKKYFFPFAVMLIAGFFKQSIITFPASAILWLLVRKERGNFWKYSIYSTSLITIGFLLCYLCYGHDFFFNFFTARRIFITQEVSAMLDLQSVALALLMSISFFMEASSQC